MDESKYTHDLEAVRRGLDILRILQEKTDEETTISQSDLLKLLEERGHACSERTLPGYLRAIMRELNPEDEDGVVKDGATIDDYRIMVNGLEEKLKNRDMGLLSSGSKLLQLRKLCYRQLFSFEELNELVEAVLFLKNIDDAEKEKLIRRLQTLSSVNYPKHSPYISANTGQISKKIRGVFEDSRTDEKVVRENLKLIRDAVEYRDGMGCKIKFHFCGYDERKKRIPRCHEDGSLMDYVVNPYYVILYNSKYYLVCNVEPYTDVSIYRIDLMFDITLKTAVSRLDGKTPVSETRKAKSKVEGLPAEWNERSASRFQAEHLYMFYGKAEEVTLKFRRERYTLLHDYFGDHYQFRRHLDDDWDEVVVRCVPDAMTHFALQCCDYVEVLQPEDLREQIRKRIFSLAERYLPDRGDDV